MTLDRFTRSVPGLPSRPFGRWCHAGHFHSVDAVLTRRRFVQVASGVTATAALVGTMPPRGAAAAAPGVGLAEPIRASIEFFPGVEGQVQAPPFTGIDTDPATVTNFQGAVGIAFISGQVERRNRRTGETRTLPFSFSDMRFMQGVFRGRDGRERDATFAFI